MQVDSHAKIILTADGSHSLESAKFAASYHSTHGAIQETDTVFIQAALAHQFTKGPEQLAILEIGFGTGLNALMSYLYSQKEAPQCQIQYLALEAYPISSKTAEALNYTQELGAPTKQATFLAMHSQPNRWQTLAENFNFCLNIQRFEDLSAQNAFDIVYYDAFSPNVQAELWEEPMLKKIYEAMRPGACLTTYCAKGAFKRLLKSIGFRVEALPGPKGKREMTRAFKEA